MKNVSKNFDHLKSISIFEPSVGDGVFVTAFNSTRFPKSIQQFSFTAIDRILPELRKAQVKSKINKRTSTKYSFSKIDFLEYQKDLKRKFSLIVGNPPYLKKTRLNKKQVGLCQEIHASANLAPATVKNIWSAFLVRCTQLLKDDGILALVLPAELLQVKFSAELRAFLIANFQRTEIFTFDDLLFECKGQDTVLLIGYKQSEIPGQFYTNIQNKEQLENNNFVLSENTALASTETKWTHHLLAADDLNYIFNLGEALQNINHYSDSKPGIVTAANKFFIVDSNTIEEYGLENYARPIIQKGLFVNGSVVFNNRDFEALVESGKPTKVLCFTDEDANNLPQRVLDYLQLGVVLKLPTRYKCTKRQNWFVVPNISTHSAGLFFKRSHFYPKLLKNNAEVLVTDSAYKVEMREGFSINPLIYSFYNSLTLAFAELHGRYYGGGVLELTPSEFKGLPVPYVPIGAREFNTYTRDFENKTDISDVLDRNDFHILNTALGLNLENIERVKAIYNTLTAKRFRTKS